MNNIYKVCIAMATMFSISNASAVTYNNSSTSETPFDVLLDTGSYGWVLSTTPTVQSTDTTSTHGHSSTSTTDEIVTEVTPAEIGVPGVINVYEDTTTTTSTSDHTILTQRADIDYSASLSAIQSTPQDYILTGTIEKQSGASLYSNMGSLSFILDLGVSFDSNPVGIDGMLKFEFGSDPEAWAYSYSTEFSNVTDTISLDDGEYINLESQIYFTATYSIFGASASFSVDDISLDVSAISGDDFYSNHASETTTERFLLSSVEIPALVAPVPVPAAAWLMFSGLVGLTLVGRRQKS